MNEYKIKKVFNNNVVLVEKNDEDFILIGKGIGFARQKGSYVKNVDTVEHIFISTEKSDLIKNKDILSDIDPKIALITEKILNLASKKLDMKFKVDTHLGMIDHINFAIRRLKEGISLKNPFLEETKFLFPIEFEIAKECLNILKRETGINIPDDEAGFIALHLNSAKESKSKKDLIKLNQIVNKIEKLLSNKNIDVLNHPFDFKRFIDHIKDCIKRNNDKKNISNPLLKDILNKMSEEYEISKEINNIIFEELNISLSDDELGFIAVHVYKLKNL